MSSATKWAASVCTAILAYASGLAPALAQITIDGTANGQAQSLAGPTYTINSSLGRAAGNNLFHSFGVFSLPNAGDTARFTGAVPGATIQNIISRVTGGARSDINGKIQVDAATLPGANLFLMNPAGIMFGPTAQLDVPGSFHATTASYIGFANGDRFFADPNAAGSTFSAADPSAFGFLGPNANKIEVNGSQLSVSNGKTLSFVAGDVSVHANGAQGAGLKAAQGTVNLFSLGGAGEIGLDGTTTAPLGGNVTIAGVLGAGFVSKDPNTFAPNMTSVVNVRGNGGGNVRVVSGSFTMTDTHMDAGNTGPTTTDAAVTIAATRVELNRSAIDASTRLVGGGDAPDITIMAPGSLSLLGTSVITVGTGNSTGLPAAPGDPYGNGGDIGIVAGDITILGDNPIIPASILSGTSASGNSGSITIEAQNLTMRFANIGVSAVSTGGGNIGDIKITVANALSMDAFSAISAFNSANQISQPGTITVEAGSIVMKQASLIITDTLSGGNAGDIRVTVRGSFLIDGTNPNVCTAAAACVDTGITAGVGILAGAGTATGAGGTITVNAGNLTILGGGIITTATFAIGNAGTTTVNVSGTLRIDAMGGVKPTVYDTGAPSIFDPFFAQISSSTFDVGDAGKVFVTTGDLGMSGGGNITTTSFQAASGKAGDISVTAAGAITMTGVNTYIQSQSLGANVAGNISVSAGSLNILQDAGITTDTRTNFNAGTIRVDVAGALVIDGTGHTGFVTGITSDALPADDANPGASTGNAGSVTVNAGDLTLKNNAAISSNTNTNGDAGAVTVNVAGTLLIDGTVRTLATDYTAISSVANNDLQVDLSSRAGNVSVTAGTLILLTNGQILADTYTNGDAGTITVNAGQLIINGSGQSVTTGIISDTFVGTGRAGSVTVNAGSATLSNLSKIATETGAAGDGGAVVATFGTLDMDGGASISSTSFDTGNAGSVTVISPGVITLSGANTTIQSRALGTGEAGPVTIIADQLILKDGASVTTQAAAGGGGNITLQINDLLYLLNSSITTTVAGGSGSGGDIYISNPEFVVLNNSTILAQAFAGNGGNITIVAGQFLRSNNSIVDASSSLGISGQISISSPETDVVSGTVNLPTGLGSESKLDQRACVGPGEVATLSLVPVGRGGLVLIPDASLSDPAFLVAGRDAGPPRSASAHGLQLAQFKALPMVASATNCLH